MEGTTWKVKEVKMILEFRAWHPKEKKMVYFDLFDIERGEVMDPSFENRYCKLNECKLMASTPLKDKNDVEIYEGDIVRGMHYEEQGDKSVMWWGTGWYTGYDVGRCRNVTSLNAVINPEVIGNIYENPDLLEACNVDKQEKTE